MLKLKVVLKRKQIHIVIKKEREKLDIVFKSNK